MAKSRSSRQWLREHEQDYWVRLAREEGWRSRAVFKLRQIDEQLRLFRDGQLVVDLGAAPGGWCQYLTRRYRCDIVAVDLLPIDPLPGVRVVEGDFREQPVLERLLALLNGRGADVVLSDMAPNISGIRAVDQPRAMYLAELALEFAMQHLRPGGHWVCKVFQGEGFDELLRQARRRFDDVRLLKPAPSRQRSREQYMVGYGLRDGGSPA